jgi:hypothetical protein
LRNCERVPLVPRKHGHCGPARGIYSRLLRTWRNGTGDARDWVCHTARLLEEVSFRGREVDRPSGMAVTSGALPEPRPCRCETPWQSQGRLSFLTGAACQTDWGDAATEYGWLPGFGHHFTNLPRAVFVFHACNRIRHGPRTSPMDTGRARAVPASHSRP